VAAPEHHSIQPVGTRSTASPSLPFLLLAFFLSGCASLPKPQPAWTIHHDVETTNTTWARTFASAAAEHPGSSGIELLPYGFDALAARLALADTAERTLDLQYYMWLPDASGRLVVEHVLRAADRGVRVRFLLDDIGGSTSDEILLALSSHTNIEVRIFNPVANRTFRNLSTLFDLSRVSRRMHNKAFTADNSLTILGGRNVGDRYFGVGDAPRFADFEAVAAGPVAQQVTTIFEHFWYSPSAIPIKALSRKRIPPERWAELRSRLASQVEPVTNSAAFKPLAPNDFGSQLLQHKPALVWGPVRLLSDHPEKIIDAHNPAANILPEIRKMFDSTQREVLIVSPYFVPGKKGVAFLRALRERGVRVVVLSNSLAANDVSAVHAGYRRYRKDLLRAGVEMWEMKPDVHIRASASQSQLELPREDNRPRSSLHTKAFIFDRRTLFVGSLNLDPRSAWLNTEMGLDIEIPALAGPMADLLQERLVQNAYRLVFVPAPGKGKTCGHIVWISQEAGTEVHYTHEPLATFSQRLLVALVQWLPIESQL
jgi:putative cardiolipin synthase